MALDFWEDFSAERTLRLVGWAACNFLSEAGIKIEAERF